MGYNIMLDFIISSLICIYNEILTWFNGIVHILLVYDALRILSTKFNILIHNYLLDMTFFFYQN